MRYAPLIVGLLVGCGSDAATPSDAMAVDAPIDAAACSSNANCTAPLGVCDVTGSKTCVECTATDHTACVGVEPVCGADQTCHACKAHSECTSEVCLPDGSCAAEGDVAYVDGTAGAGTTCTKSAPCKTMTAAATTAKATVKLKGATSEPAGFTVGASIRRVFGAANAQIATATVTPIVVASANTNIEFHQVTIGNEPGIQPPACILINAGTTATVKVFGGKVYGCQLGVSNASSTGTLALDGVTVTGNTSGGIQVSGGSFAITNSMVHHNGSSTSNIGGVKLDVAPSTSTFAFNTVVDNDAAAGQTRGGGVLCDVAAFSMLNNIIARNRANSDANAATAQTSGQCQSQTSSIQSDFTGLNFKSAVIAPFDYHLLVGSKAIDAAATTSIVVLDIDGDTRPQGAGKDQGADEYKP